MQAELQYSQFPLSASTLLHFIAATTKLVSIPNLTRMTAMAKEGTKTVQPCWLRWQHGWIGHLSKNYSPWDSTFQLEKNPSPFFEGAFLRWHPRITTLISSRSREGAGRLGRGNRNSALGLSVGLGGRWRVTPGPWSAPSKVTHTQSWVKAEKLLLPTLLGLQAITWAPALGLLSLTSTWSKRDHATTRHLAVENSSTSEERNGNEIHPVPLRGITSTAKSFIAILILSFLWLFLLLSSVLKGFSSVNLKKDKTKKPQMITENPPCYPQDSGLLDTTCIQKRNSINFQQWKSIIYYCLVIKDYDHFNTVISTAAS